MKERVVVHKGSYHDSAFLMRVARDLNAQEDVAESVVLMGTEMNVELLRSAGFDDPALDGVGPMDMLVGLRAKSEEGLDAVEAELARLLLAGAQSAAKDGPRRYGGLDEALADRPDTNLVSVAVPGTYAAFVAEQALDAGRHVFLFSNNVALEDEIRLKERAVAEGRLLMGPDCGTAILAGVGLGFANRARRGAVGMVGASGTGLQEVSCLLHNAGVGISQAIGTGSRDLAAEVGGRMSEFGLRLLAEDSDTQVLVLICKHPAEEVAERMHDVLAGLGKPSVVRYLGDKARDNADGVRYADSLDEAASMVLEALGHKKARQEFDVEAMAAEILGGANPLSGRLVGLFGGGSLASEAALVLRNKGLQVQVPEHPLEVEPALEGEGHLIVDTGEDFYTQGKPHPMVDQAVRCALIRDVGRDPAVDCILLDLVLGDGAHLDPAPEMAQAVEAARKARGGKGLFVIASLSGTDLDPQGLERQRNILRGAGVVVQPSAARAAALAAVLLGGKTS